MNSPYSNELLKQQSALDFFSFNSPADVLAPHPDLFESELDSSLADFDQLHLQLLTVDQSDAFSFLRSDTPTCGPPSTITVSSESTSAYDSISSHSYNYTPTNYSFPLELDMDFRRVGLNAASNYAAATAAQKTASGLSIDAVADGSYGTSEPSAANSPDDDSSFGALPHQSSAQHSGSVYSDYGSDYYPAVSSHPSLRYSGTTVSPANLSPHPRPSEHSPAAAGLALPFLPPLSREARAQAVAHAHAQTRSDNGDDGLAADDPRKKYQCSQCPRAFARAYNLKTHMATHDPHRLKAHVCPHRACGRSFSRKHDLGRHLVSIHRDDPPPKVGIAGLKDGRSWCEICGKSTSKDKKGCECADVK